MLNGSYKCDHLGSKSVKTTSKRLNGVETADLTPSPVNINPTCCQKHPSMAPRTSRDPPDLEPKWPQEPHLGAKMAPRPSILEPRWPQDPPSWSQDGPKTSNLEPRCSKTPNFEPTWHPRAKTCLPNAPLTPSKFEPK